MDYLKLGIVLSLLISGVSAQVPDPYEALRAKDYDRAITLFELSVGREPARADLHKDLAYTLLKTGDREAARDQFAFALALDPTDEHTALEYAFLCYETRKPLEARRVFDRLRASNPVAAEAFENIDKPLREGIARWQQALLLSPGNFSGHEELARLAEERDEQALAAEHYQKAWTLRPDRRLLLLHLGRVWKQWNRLEDSNSALLAASRSDDPYVAEQARELLPDRYPYVYEFEKALALDPANTALRRELAFLHLKMGQEAAAEAQFGILVEKDPTDSVSAAQLAFLRHTGLQPARAEPAPVTVDAKLLGERSLEKGYLNDAVRYLRQAHEDDPQDATVSLKLGQTYNVLKDDREAVRWFNLARGSHDPAVANEANRSYRNLAPTAALVRTTVWGFPMFSSRWKDTFIYAQMKTELGDAHWPLHPYLSVRGVADTRGKVNAGAGLGPQYLSERSAIVALGVATRGWKGITGWFEAGEAFHYRAESILPDYRGGVSYAKGWGQLTGATAGWFAETNDDGVFVSRFANNTLFYSQNRTGYALKPTEGAGGIKALLYWNWNVTVDALRQSWANYAETGPGIRLRFRAMPESLMFTINAVRGTYLFSDRADYSDLRIGVWYALSR